MRQLSQLLYVVGLVLCALVTKAQHPPEHKLKTNAKDTITISEMFSTDNGFGDGERRYKKLGKDVVFPAEDMQIPPMYSGGSFKLLRDTLYKIARSLYTQTTPTVIVNFVVGYNGKLSNFEFFGSQEPVSDRKLVKFIKSLPKWSAGISNNKYVKAKFSIQLWRL